MRSVPWKRHYVALAALALAVGGFFALEALKGRQAPPPPESVRPVRTRTLTSPRGALERTYQGTVLAARRVNLSFRISGPLVDLPLKKGQEVREGALLARLDPRDYRTQYLASVSQLRQLESKLAEMRSGARPEDLASLEAALKASQARFAEAESNFRRYRGLYADGAISAVQFDHYRTLLDVARSDRDGAAQALKKGRTGARKEEILQQQAAIEAQRSAVEAARAALADAELLAPFSGIVADLYVDNHQMVQAKQDILSLQDLSALEVRFHVPDADLLRRAPEELRGVTFRVTFDGLPDRSFPASFKEFSTQADPKTQTFQGTLQLPTPKGLTLLPGMAATVEVRAPQADSGMGGAYLVPVDAVFGDEKGKKYLWILRKEAVHRVEVTTGEYRGPDLAVSGPDLKPGMTVVTAGVHFLREGQKVRPLAPQN